MQRISSLAEKNSKLGEENSKLSEENSRLKNDNCQLRELTKEHSMTESWMMKVGRRKREMEGGRERGREGGRKGGRKGEQSHTAHVCADLQIGHCNLHTG